MPGKRVQFDDETWQALDLLGRDSMKEFQELADEAFRDLLRKHDRPVGLKAALRRSAGVSNVTAFPAKPAAETKPAAQARREPAAAAKPKGRKAPKRRS
jgi:hypothetical protein